MDRTFDKKIYPQLQLVFHRLYSDAEDDDDRKIFMTVDLDNEPIGHVVFSEPIYEAMFGTKLPTEAEDDRS